MTTTKNPEDRIQNSEEETGATSDSWLLNSEFREMSEIDLALCRATLYNAVALGFRPPRKETTARLIAPEGRSLLAQAATFLDRYASSDLASSVECLNRATLEELSASFIRLFGHTARGAVPPYETEYGVQAIFQQPRELADLAGFYAAFGLVVNPAQHERPDHISCECEFLSFLALKEAYGLERGDRAMLEETRKATRFFLRDHLGRFVPSFAAKLARAGESFYAALGKLCHKLVAADCERWRVPIGSESLALRQATQDPVPAACDACTVRDGSDDPL